MVPLSFHRHQQVQNLLPQRPQQWKAEELESGHQQREALVPQLPRSYLVRGAIGDPEQNQPHLIQPEELREMRRQIFGHCDAAPFNSRSEMLKIELSNVRRFVTERRKRVMRICGMPG